MPATYLSSRSRSRLGVWLAWLLCGGLWLLAPAPAQAQNCWVNSTLRLDFGTVGTASNTDAQTSVAYQCQAPSNQDIRVRLCVDVAEGNPSGYSPRRMTNYNGAYMNYNLYSDPARTNMLGPFLSTPRYTWVVDIPAGSTYSGNFNVYGRVPSGQTLPAAYLYEGHPGPAVLRFASSTNGNPQPWRCLLPDDEINIGVDGVYARFDNTCRITTATDLDFGNALMLPGNRDQTSAIQLRCPTGTAWRVGLDNGIHASGGTRRMAGPGGNHLQYELYRDSNRSLRWGNTLGIDTNNGSGSNATQSLTVYGRVPGQPVAMPGTYSDTITVTLTY